MEEGKCLRTGAKCAILDLTGVTEMNTETAAYLMRMIQAAGLLGSECLVSGISPMSARLASRARSVRCGPRFIPVPSDR